MILIILEVNFCNVDRHTVEVCYAEAVRRFGEGATHFTTSVAASLE